MGSELSEPRKQLYFFLGLVSVAMAYIGVALPGIPGIPFILLSAWLLVRSNDRMYQWLLARPVFGKVLKRFGEEGPLPLGFRWFVLTQWWVSVVVAWIWLVHSTGGRVALAVVCVLVSVLWWRFRR